MDNLLRQNLDELKEVSRMITTETGCNIIICDQDGEIIEATLKERIGKKHQGSIMILTGESDEAIITKEQEETYRLLGTDTRAGYNYVITIQGKRVGSLGVAGEPDYLKPIVRIAAKTISTYITEFLKEKQKNRILQKMARIAEEIREESYVNIDYRVFTDDLLLISGAKYVWFNLFDQDGGISTTVAISGSTDDITQGAALFGTKLIGARWNLKNNYMKTIKNRRRVCVKGFTEFCSEFIGNDRSKMLEDTLCLGGVYVLEIAYREKVIGDVVLAMKKGELVQNEILVELYTSQIGQLLKRVHAESALRSSENELKKALNILDSFWLHSPNPILILNYEGRLLRASQSAAGLFGLPSNKIEGESILDILPAQDADKLLQRIREVPMEKEPNYSCDKVLVNEEYRYYDNWLFPITEDEQEKPLIGLVALDITDRIRTEEQLKHLSIFDPMTGVYSRGYFESEMQRLRESENYPISFLSLDADCLKIINDTMGHHYGDQSLKELAQILKNSVRDSDILARIGGDEFVIILPNTDRNMAEKIMSMIRDKIAKYNLEGLGLPLSVSLGYSTIEKHGDRLEDILIKADEHMYHNKLFHKDSSRTQIINALMKTLAERECISQKNARHLLDDCMKIGQMKRLSSKTLSNLALLCKVHDIGKVSIPENILLKPEPLTESEWEIIRHHPEKGYRIAVVSQELYGVADLILKHHERWDGTGYPLGLKGKQIPIECRILAVANSYEAMVSGRPFRMPRSKEEAIQELIRCAGTQFDPEIVELFLTLIREERKEFSLF